MPVPSGTIQGSAIGRTLFCIFINNLSAVIKYCQKWLFIDDLKLVGDASIHKKHGPDSTRPRRNM